jgi:hypothetical protein
MPGSTLNGELGLLSLFDLGQLLMLNRASGELVVSHGTRKGYFYFDAGAIVNAVDDEYQEGPGAAYRLFTWKSGTFEFSAGPPNGARTIEENTEALMMEAARRMDEAGDGSAARETDRLAARATSLEALREAFQSVASQAGHRPEAQGDGSGFDLLREPEDTLLFRPDAAPRLRTGGRWCTVGSQPLDPIAYDGLRARLFEAASAVADPNATCTRVVAMENGGRFVVTRVGGEHEGLWVRAAAVAPAGAARLEGDLATLDAMLARPNGLLLVAGPDVASAERLFHACVARLGETRPGTLLLAADHERWTHPDRAGAVVHTSGADAAALARAIGPDAAAFDLAHAAEAAAALAALPRVVAAVVCAEPEGAFARWLALAGRRADDGIEAALEGGAIDVVVASALGAEARLAFQAVRVSVGEAPARPAPATPIACAPAPAPPSPAEKRGAAEKRTAAPASAAAVPPAPAPASDPLTPPAPSAASMAALAAELNRTLKKKNKAA